MKKNKLEKVALEKEISRKIVKEIESFGVHDDQKIDIMYFLALTINNTEEMQKICHFLKNYKNYINNDKKDNTIKKDNTNNKIILE